MATPKRDEPCAVVATPKRDKHLSLDELYDQVEAAHLVGRNPEIPGYPEFDTLKADPGPYSWFVARKQNGKML